MRTQEKQEQTALDEALDFYAHHLNEGARKKECDVLSRRFAKAVRYTLQAEKAIRELAETTLPVTFSGQSLAETLESEHVALVRVTGVSADAPPFENLKNQELSLETTELSKRIAALQTLQRRYSALSVKKDPPRNAIKYIHQVMCAMSDGKVTHKAVADAIHKRFPNEGIDAKDIATALQRSDRSNNGKA